MKRLFFVLVAMMLVANVIAQEKNLFWTMRVTVKMDKKLEWEKKAPLLMKTHYPQFNFRVYEVMTGSNTGSYVVSVGPISYKDLDAPPVFPKGEASAKADGQVLDAITESLEVTHYKRVDALSNLRTDRKSRYIRVNFMEMTIGSWAEVEKFLAGVEKVKQSYSSKLDVAYYRPANSGAVNRFAIVRYMDGLDELDLDEKFEEKYDAIHGKHAWYNAFQNYLSMMKSTDAELWALRSDLSSVGPSSVSAN